MYKTLCEIHITLNRRSVVAAQSCAYKTISYSMIVIIYYKCTLDEKKNNGIRHVQCIFTLRCVRVCVQTLKIYSVGF